MDPNPNRPSNSNHTLCAFYSIRAARPRTIFVTICLDVHVADKLLGTQVEKWGMGGV